MQASVNTQGIQKELITPMTPTSSSEAITSINQRGYPYSFQCWSIDFARKNFINTEIENIKAKISERIIMNVFNDLRSFVHSKSIPNEEYNGSDLYNM
ncbi:hypothetical protein BP422_19205 [Brevibacillus formosus]|uniref:Uncharacterized protein n=1 Tax=Brevibacillus formosus TaxID=54913 RepID=A0A220MK25_9BACL|nr:hypothetical protein BP422_19205 [Brevibacillus formosus]